MLNKLHAFFMTILLKLCITRNAHTIPIMMYFATDQDDVLRRVMYVYRQW